MTVVIKVKDVDLLGDVPARWLEGANTKYRCPSGHVSLRCDLCTKCRQPVLLTFPEDAEGNILGAEFFSPA